LNGAERERVPKIAHWRRVGGWCFMAARVTVKRRESVELVN
jgi:hypothetical protein